jgi:hypothetical protein
VEFFVFGYLIYGVIFGAFCSYVAGTKNRDAGAWFILRFFFGIIALLAVGFAASATTKPRTGGLLRCRQCEALLTRR